MVEAWDDAAERRLVALALYGAVQVAARARAALKACPPHNDALRGILESRAGYEVSRERRLVRQAWPHDWDVGDLLDYLQSLRSRRELLREILELHHVHASGDDRDVAAALRRLRRPATPSLVPVVPGWGDATPKGQTGKPGRRR